MRIFEPKSLDDLKRRVIRSLDRNGRRRWIGVNKRLARIVLGEVADIPSPKILELGAGLGGLSRKLLEKHPTAQVTVTDIDPTFVAAVAADDLGSHPRATVREMDATAIDAPDGYYDLAVFALSLHHLAPERAAQVIVEGTRASGTFQKCKIKSTSQAGTTLHLVAAFSDGIMVQDARVTVKLIGPDKITLVFEGVETDENPYERCRP